MSSTKMMKLPQLPNNDFRMLRISESVWTLAYLIRSRYNNVGWGFFFRSPRSRKCGTD